MAQRKTHEQYVEELKEKNPNVKVIDRYINASTKILHHCLIHDVDWRTAPSVALQGCGCPYCHTERITDKLKKSHQEYIEELKEKNPDIEVVEQYIDTKTKIQHYCLKHDVYWKAAPYNVLLGKGCEQCKSEKLRVFRIKTNEQYVNELKNINPNIIPLEEYMGAAAPMLHKCLLHNVVWTPIPHDLLSGRGCKQCGIDKMTEKANARRLTQDEYEFDVYQINPQIEVVGKYVDCSTKIMHRCKIDGYEWLVTPDSIKQGTGCPKCNQSHGEREISLWLTHHDIDFIPQYRFDDCVDKKQLPFDFYLSQYNLCIEFDGVQHFRPVNFGGISDEEAYNNFLVVQRHDDIKNKYCEDNNIKLLRIPYFKNIEEELNNFLFI